MADLTQSCFGKTTIEAKPQAFPLSGLTAEQAGKGGVVLVGEAAAAAGAALALELEADGRLGARQVTGLEREIVELQKENRMLREERDVLMKATVFLAERSK